MKHRIAAPIQLLDRGQTVATLHQVLVFLPFTFQVKKTKPND